MSLSLDALLARLSTQKMPKPGARLELAPLAGSADALAIAQLASRGRMLVVITANPLDAQRLQDEIAWAAPGLRAHLLPDWETLPYDNFSPHQDLISERLSTLYAISRGETDIVLVPASPRSIAWRRRAFWPPTPSSSSRAKSSTSSSSRRRWRSPATRT